MIILFLGPPGVGKTTLAKFAAEKLNLNFIDIGDILRRIAEDDPALAEKMNSGELADDTAVNRLVFEKVSKSQGKFVLDGFPRTVSQAQILDHFLDEHHLKVDHLFEVTAPLEVLKARILARGREDDTQEAIEERLEIYHHTTHLVLDFLRIRGYQIVKINNAQSLPETEKELLERLNTV
jgi:adenylate kinase